MPQAAVGAFLQKMLINFVVSLVVNMVTNKLFGKKGGDQAMERSLLVNKQSNNDPIPVVYGRKRVGGVRAYVDTSNGSGAAGTNHLNIALTMCEGRMSDTLKKVIFNDTIIWDADDGGTSTGSATAGFTLGGFKTTKYSNYVEAQYFPGAADQTVSTLLQNSIGSTDWSNNHRLRGIAYLAIVLEFNGEAFEGGVPLITAEIAGKKIVDVRNTTDFASPTYDASEDQNPVDVLYDYLTNDIFGKGIAYTDIDTASFQTVATYVYNSGTPKYKINGDLDTSRKIYENINEITNAFNGYLIYTGGKYSLKIRKPSETAVFAFDTDNIVSDLEISLADVNSKLNKIQATFSNKDLEAEEDVYSAYNDDIVVVENSSYLTADNDKVLEQRIDQKLVTDETLITTLLTHKLDASRTAISVQFEAAHTALQVEAGDIVSVTHAQAGFDAKLFRVLALTLTQENTIQIIAQEYDGSIEI